MDAYRLGRVCRALRMKKHWRQADLAVRAGVSASSVSRLERGLVRELGVDVVMDWSRPWAAASTSSSAGRAVSWTDC